LTKEEAKVAEAEFAKAADLLAPAEGEREIYLKTLDKKVRIQKVNIGDIADIMKISSKEQNDVSQYIYLCFKGLKEPKLTLDECRKLPFKVIMELAMAIAKFSELDKESMDQISNLLAIRS